MIEVYRLPANRERPSTKPCAACTSAAANAFVQAAFDELIGSDAGLSQLVRELQKNRLQAVVFGGWTRDRLAELLTGQSHPSRDIDFVSSGSPSVKSLFPPEAARNPFGGVGYDSLRIHIDAWDLPETFLFRRNTGPIEFDRLPSTADYNVNAVIFQPSQFFDESGLLDFGACEALVQKKLDFMADEVAQPRFQAARSVILAARLGLSISDTVQKFVRDVCSTQSALASVTTGIENYCPLPYRSEALERLRTLLNI